MNKAFGIIMCVLAAGCGNKGEAPQGLSADDIAFQKTAAGAISRRQARHGDRNPGRQACARPRAHAARERRDHPRRRNSTSSILSFKNEISGPEGMLVYAQRFHHRESAIEDTKGDGLKINDGENITIRGVRVAWTGGPKTTNGAYGIYPVKITQRADRGLLLVRRLRRRHLCGPVDNVIVRRNSCGTKRRRHRDREHHQRRRLRQRRDRQYRRHPGVQHAESDAARPLHAGVQEQGVREQSRQFCRQGRGGGERAGRARAWWSIPTAKVEIFDNDIADNRPPISSSRAYYSTNYYNKGGVDPNYEPYPALDLCLRQSLRRRRRLTRWPGSQDTEGGDVRHRTGISRTFSGTAIGTRKISSTARRRPPSASASAMAAPSCSMPTARTSTRIPAPTWRRFSASLPKLPPVELPRQD